MTIRRSAMALGGMGAAALVLSACVSTSPVGSRRAALARAPGPTCTQISFPIYFQTGSDQMAPEQAQVISQAALSVKDCAVSKLDVVGLAGLEGGKDATLDLAKRRSVVVADALKAAGLPTPRFDMGAVGSEGAKTKRGRSAPLRGRAEVIIYAGAKPAAAG